jgi:hypothetical protein
LFQSLFSWITLNGAVKRHMFHEWAGFQSLFSWITLNGRVVNSLAKSTAGVSILVFVDHAQRLPNRPNRWSELEFRHHLVRPY